MSEFVVVVRVPMEAMPAKTIRGDRQITTERRFVVVATG
jgi:hypothetical protein